MKNNILFGIVKIIFITVFYLFSSMCCGCVCGCGAECSTTLCICSRCTSTSGPHRLELPIAIRQTAVTTRAPLRPPSAQMRAMRLATQLAATARARQAAEVASCGRTMVWTVTMTSSTSSTTGDPASTITSTTSVCNFLCPMVKCRSDYAVKVAGWMDMRGPDAQRDGLHKNTMAKNDHISL